MNPSGAGGSIRRPLEPPGPAMTPVRRLVDRSLGRNAQLLAEAAAALPSREDRYPYLRVLVGLIESAHPELTGAPRKDRTLAEHARLLSDGALDADEVAEIVAARDEERGLAPPAA